MDEPTANQFINSLVKSVQALCNGYIDFSSTVEVVGHIHLNIDRKVKLDYVLTEEVSKAVGEDATLFSSHSYHSKPPGGLISEDLTEKPESALTPKSSSTNSSRRKSHHVPRVDDSESFSFTSVSQVTSHTHTINNTSAAEDAKEKLDTSYSNNSDISHESTSVQNTEKESWRTVSNSVPSSQDRRRKSSCGLITSAAKHRRTSQEDLKSEQPDPLLVHIKEEPEDDLPVYQGSVVETSAEDLAAPDFSSVVMESLDHVGQNEVTSFMTGTQGQHMQLKPYPVLLHATPELNLTSVSQPVPGLSSNTPPVPSTSTDNMRAKVSSSMTIEFREYKKYSQADAARALHLVHMGLSLSASQTQTGVPMTTIFRMTKRCQEHSGNCRGAYISASRHQQT